MDKYEYRIKTEQMLEYMENKSYDKAIEIADTIDWRRVKNASMLCSVSEIYEFNEQYEKSRDILFIAYDRSPGSRKIIYRLGVLALKVGDVNEAMDCYEEFVSIAPKDPNQYILKFKILKAQKAPITQQIEALTDFKKAEYVEKWAYELAKLYHEAGMTTECLAECDDLILWFSEGRYVFQAMELKMLYKPLTPSQQEKYASRNQAEKPKKSQFVKRERTEGTSTLAARMVQAAAAGKTIEELGVTQAFEPIRVQSSFDSQNDMLGEISLEEPMQEMAETVAEEPVKQHIKELAKEEVAESTTTTVQSVVKAVQPDVEGLKEEDSQKQITGQLSIDDILTGWEDKQKEVEEAKKEQHIVRKNETAPILTEDIRKLMEELENGVPEEQPELEEVPIIEEEDEPVINKGLTVEHLSVDEVDNLDETEEFYEEMQENDLDADELDTDEDESEIYDDNDDLDSYEEIEEENQEAYYDEADALDEYEDIEDEDDEYYDDEDEDDEYYDDEDEDEGDENDEDQDEYADMDDYNDEFIDDEDEEALDEDEEDTEYEEMVKELHAERGPSRKEIAKAVATGKTAQLPVAEIAAAVGKQDTGFIVQGRYDLSATSEVGLRAGLTEEQKKLFSYFVPVRGMSEQLVDVLEQDKHCINREGTSKTGNLLIIGRQGSGKTVLAVDVVKAIQKNRNIRQGKVAIVTGDALNRKKVSEIVSKLHGGALIIEKASQMNEKTIIRLNKAMERDTGEMLVVLEEQRKPLDQMLASNKEFRRKFTSRLEVPIFINDELVTFGQTYAKENGYKIDEMGILALYSRIDAKQREDHAVTVAEVKEIMDEAIEHSQKVNVKKIMKKVFGKGTDDSDRIYLTEKDFNI